MRWSNGIVSEIMKIIDEREPQAKNKQKKNKNKDRKEQVGQKLEWMGGWVGAKLFCCAFKSDFLQLIRKVSLIFKWNLN